MKKIIKSMDRAMALVEYSVLIVAISLMIIVCMIQVVNRRVINIGAIWTEEVMRILLVWTICAGASVATGKRQHLGVTFFVDKMPQKIGRWVRLVTDLLCVFVAVYVVVSGAAYVSLQFKTNAIFSVTRMPQPVAQLAIPICFAFVAIRLIFTIIEDISKWNASGDASNTELEAKSYLEKEGDAI